MDLARLIDHVGADNFNKAQASAWEAAAGTGNSSKLPPQATDESTEVTHVPHELNDLIWFDEDLPWAERVATTFRLYRAMPSYAVLMTQTGFYDKLDVAARGLLWDEYRSLISDLDDRLADPAGYSLWCDWFENRKTVTDAWNALVASKRPSDRGLERILILSGPVPYSFKETLYKELVPHVRWHYFIFRSLLHSAFDVYGDLQPKAAAAILAGLTLPAATEHLDKLREVLRSWKRRGPRDS